MQFSYEALSAAGESVRGVVEAVDRRSAVTVLSERGQYVVTLQAGAGTENSKSKIQNENLRARPSVLTGGSGSGGVKVQAGRLRGEQKVRQGWWGRVTKKDVIALTGQLSTALRSGLPLMDCLKIIRQQSKKQGMINLLEDLEHQVSTGVSLSEAMGRHKRVFGPLYCAMVRVGETGGILDHTTSQLTRLLGRDEQIRTQMRNAAAYPLFVLGLGLASVVVITTGLLPRVVGTIYEGTAQLPWPTQMLMGISGFVGSPWGALTGVVAAAVVWGLWRWHNSSSGKVRWDSFKLRIPVLGAVLRSIAVGRFARTFGALTQGGVGVLESLGVVRDTLGNEVLGREIDEVIEEVRGGAPLAEPLAWSGRFPPLLVQIVAVGEQTGKLDELLLSAADTFDAEADAAIARFMAIMPAVLVLLLAVVIGFIVVATLLPIVGMELGVGGI